MVSASFADTADALRTAEVEHDEVMVERRLKYLDALSRPFAHQS